jgi:hypothetical protein
VAQEEAKEACGFGVCLGSRQFACRIVGNRNRIENGAAQSCVALCGHDWRAACGTFQTECCSNLRNRWLTTLLHFSNPIFKFRLQTRQFRVDPNKSFL